jgi:tetratricopeptide (TPR) repeat protein
VLRQPVQRSSPLSLWLVGAALGVALTFQSTVLFGSPSAACGRQAQFQALLSNGANSKLSPSARMAALEEAVKLCPRNLAAYNDLAVLLLQQQDFERALSWIRRGLQASPRNPALTLDLGVALLSVGQPQNALQVFKSLPLSAKTEFYLGMAYRALGEHQAARHAMASSFHMGYDNPYLLYLLIEQDRALHDPQAGLRDFKIFDQNFPHSAWLHLLLGEVYEQRNDSPHAEAEYKEAASLDPRLPIVHYQLGRIDFNLADYSDAAEEFQREIALDPSFGDAYLYSGVALRRLGKDDAALPYLAQAVAREPNNVLGYTALAAAQTDAHQPKAALEALEAGERRFPKEAAFPAQLSYLMRRMGDVSGANKQAALAESLSRKNNRGLSSVVYPGIPGNPVIRRSPHPSPTHPDLVGVPPPSQAGGGNGVEEARAEMQTLGQCVESGDAACVSTALSRFNDARLQQNAAYLNLEARALDLLRRRKEALAAAQEAVRIDPKRPSYLITQGLIEQRMGDEVPAIRSFLRAEKLRPGAAAPFYDVGMSFFLIGRYNNQDTFYLRAAKNFQTALKLDPHDDKAEFMLGAVAEIGAKLDDAQRDFQRAIQLNPSNPYCHLHYGKVLSRLGDQAGAIREMEMAERLDPSYARSYFNLGDLLAQIGNLKRAKEQLERGIRLEPNFGPAYYTLGRVDYRLGLKVKSREAFREFQEMKSQEQKGKNPIRASSNAVTSPTERQ